jgi:uncharacterized lipoprotein YddW (UPF0748 family)
MRVAAIVQAVTCAVSVAAVTVSGVAAPGAGRQPEPVAETRALWVTRTTLASPAGVAALVTSARAAGFNTLIVQVRGRGDAYYRSRIEPRAAELRAHPAFDPLAETLRLARASGLRVHAWVAVNLISSAVDLPASPQHVLRRHPEWLMVPRELAAELRGTSPRSAAYVSRLARWSRARGDVEGLYLSPIHPGAVDHFAAVVRDLLSTYDVDGLHLDYVRFPGDEFDYSRGAIAEFERTLLPNMNAQERRHLPNEARADPLLYPRRFPIQWTTFRQSRLTDLVERVRETARAARPTVVVSAAVIPDADEARARRLQDWPLWVKRSLLDVLCPMAYTTDAALFEQQIAAARRLAGDRAVWAGVGAYRLTPAAVVAHIEAARRQDAAGVVLFSYDALVAPPNDAASLGALGRAAFGGSP